MEQYNEDDIKDVEERVQKIRDKALKLAQQTNPDITFVVDNRTISDYSYKQWDYPGVWYTGFTLPEGFRNEAQLVQRIAADTIDFFDDKKKKKVSDNAAGRIGNMIASTIDRFFRKFF